VTVATDLALPYGGSLTWDRRGRPRVVRDTPQSAAATLQQVAVLVETVPRLLDVDGVGAGRPDNLFYPKRGGGARAFAGVLPTPQRISAMRARIVAGLLAHPAVAATPPPVVTVTADGVTLLASVVCYTTTGERVDYSRALGG
jgi:hypothetical protein